ncbi:hypothetical protein U0070_009515, partial [Myodes glareolus]
PAPDTSPVWPLSWLSSGEVGAHSRVVVPGVVGRGRTSFPSVPNLEPKCGDAHRNPGTQR